MFQLGFVGSELGHIGLNADEVRDRAGGIAQRRHSQAVPEETPVLPLVPDEHGAIDALRDGFARPLDFRLGCVGAL